ncbi:MAG: F0F1 ATP synthase subunit gamma [Actinomycetota bacterium]
MGAQLRELRRRVRSVESTKKITRAQELIAASRITKAQQRAQAARPYTETLIAALEAAAEKSRLDHPLIESAGEPRRSAVLVVTSDRGFAGAYTSSVIREAEALSGLLAEQGQEVVPYVVGTKGVTWFRFRGRTMGGEYTGFSGTPAYSDAQRIRDDLLAAFDQPTEEGGIDEIHVVWTHFRNMVSQEVRARRLFPVVVEYVPEPVRRLEAGTGSTESTGSVENAGSAGGAGSPGSTAGGEGTSVPTRSATPAAADQPVPLYEFEPSPEEVLDALLPQYAGNLVYTTLLDAAASEWAARRRAMKSATDNAAELQETLTREANQARQAEITQEISEIVGGANALAAAQAE